MRLRRPALAISIVLAGLAAVGGGLLGARLLAQPEAALIPPGTGSGTRVQQALGELVMRATGVSSRTEPLVLTSGDLTEFMARHLQGRRLSLRPLVVQAGEDELQLAGRTSLGQLTARSWFHPFLARLPAAVQDLDLWVSVRGALVLHQGELDFAVRGALVGQQPVPPSWLWQTLGFDPEEQLRGQLPRVIERIELKPGRLILYTRHRGS
jgi:hypothetical protein